MKHIKWDNFTFENIVKLYEEGRILSLDVEATSTLSHLCTVQIYFPPQRKVLLFHFSKFQELTSVYQVEVESQSIQDVSKHFTKQNLISLLSTKYFMCHSGGYDFEQIQKYLGISVKIAIDTWVLAHILPIPNLRKKSLNSLSGKYLKDGKHGAWNDYVFSDETLDKDAILYASKDTVITYRSFEEMFSRYKELFKNSFPSFKLEMQMLYFCVFLKNQGLKVDVDKLTRVFKLSKKRVEFLKESFFSLAGEVINLGSRAKLADLLFNKLDFTPVLHTPKGAPSTSIEALQNLLPDPLISNLLSFKEAESQLTSIKTMLTRLEDSIVSYPEPIPLSESQGARLYFKNPSTTSLSWEVRDSIIPFDSNKKLIYVDIKAAELVLFAFYAGEEVLLRPYEEGFCLHEFIAQKLEFIAGKEASKVVTFAILYGSEGSAVSKALKISQAEAETLLSRYLSFLTKIAGKREDIISRLSATGRVSTPFGRYRFLPEVFNGTEKKKALRKGLNYVAQSGIAEVIKSCLVFLHQNLPQDSRIITSVFDSVLIEASDESVETVRKLVKESLNIYFPMMRKRFQFNFNFGVGKTWKEAKENAK